MLCIAKVSGLPSSGLIFEASSLDQALEAARFVDLDYDTVQVFSGKSVRVFMPSEYADGFKQRVLRKEFEDTPLFIRHRGSPDFEKYHAHFEFKSEAARDIEDFVRMTPRDSVIIPVM